MTRFRLLVLVLGLVPSLSCEVFPEYYEICMLLDECGYAVEAGSEGVEECQSKLDVVLESGRYEAGTFRHERQYECRDQIEQCVQRSPSCSELRSQCDLEACDFFMTPSN